MRSLSLVRMPCFRRCSMISTTSPNHEGVEGTECEEVWMMTEESAILVMCTSLLGKMCILPQERHILCLLATNYISLRNSWDMPGYKRPPYQTEPRILPQRRARPDNQQWKIPPSEWPLVLARIDQGESLRKVAS